MQCTVIEYARDVLGWKDANSTEFDENTTHPVIDLMEEQRGITQKGGTMRLGAYPCVLKKDSLASKLYGTTEYTEHTEKRKINVPCNSVASVVTISERHRHRYEFANDTKAQKAIEAAGLVASGLSPDGKLVEIVELPGHPYFIASQFHPEFKSRPTIPHPLFNGLVKAALKNGKREKGRGKREKGRGSEE
jgi:CTP synthase